MKFKEFEKIYNLATYDFMAFATGAAKVEDMDELSDPAQEYLEALYKFEDALNSAGIERRVFGSTLQNFNNT